MLALVLEVFAAVGPCRPVQVSEASLPCFAFFCARYSLLPSSWYTVATLPGPLFERPSPTTPHVDRQSRFVTGQPCLPCGHLSSQLSFCLGACRQLPHRADAGIQASRRRIVEGDPKNHGEPDYTCTYSMYLQHLLVPATRPRSASWCHRQPLDSSRSPAHDKEQASTSLFIAQAAQDCSHG